MFFRAVGRRIAVDIDSWRLPLTRDEALTRLRALGFTLHAQNFHALALSVIGKSAYRRGASIQSAPHAFDCSSFVKWLYAKQGVWIPRRCLHQFTAGMPVEDGTIRVGDLVFLNNAPRPQFPGSQAQVNHVGIVIDNGVVAHATINTTQGIDRETLSAWLQKKSWRGARRFIPANSSILTLEIPPDREIETSDDVYWHLLETLDWVT